MIVFICTNEKCPRHGQRTEKVCTSRVWHTRGYGMYGQQGGMSVCLQPARKDFS